MPSALFIAPSGAAAGLTSVALGVVAALDSRGVRVAFFKPIGQHAGAERGPERSTLFARETLHMHPTEPIPLAEAERLLLAGCKGELMSRIMTEFHRSSAGADVTVVE